MAQFNFILKADKFFKRIKQIRNTVASPSSFWKITGLYLHKILLETFNKEGARAGHPKWTKLADRTILRKRRAKKERKLQWTGHLRMSFRTLSQGKTFLNFGSRLIYAAAHQYGIPERNLPARPMLFLTGADKDIIISKYKFFKKLS